MCCDALGRNYVGHAMKMQITVKLSCQAQVFPWFPSIVRIIIVEEKIWQRAKRRCSRIQYCGSSPHKPYSLYLHEKQSILTDFKNFQSIVQRKIFKIFVTSESFPFNRSLRNTSLTQTLRHLLPQAIFQASATGFGQHSQRLKLVS